MTCTFAPRAHLPREPEQNTMLRMLTSCLPLPAVLLSSLLLAPAEAAIPPDSRTLEPLDLQLAWTAQAVMNRSRDKIRYITNDEDQVYIQSSAGVVTAFNAETGRRMWARQVGRNDDYAMEAVSNDDLLVLITGPVAWGLNKFTGNDEFRYRLKRLPTAPPAVENAAVYFPLGDGAVYGYAIQTLIHLDRYGTLPPGVARPHLWRFVSNERVVMPPVATEDVVAFCTEQKNLHSLSAAGVSYYQEFLNAPASAPLALDVQGDRRNILMATEDGNLFSFDLTRGTLTWDVPVERRVSEPPLVIGDFVFVVTEGQGVSCVSNVTGTYVQLENEQGLMSRWQIPGIVSLVGVAGKHLYGMDRNRRVVAMHLETGKVSGRTVASGYTIHHQNSVTDRLYLTSPAGELICLKPVGSDFAVYHQRPENEPLDVDVPDSDDPPAEDGDE